MIPQHNNTDKWLDQGLLNWALNLFKPQSMIDIGCGLGGTKVIAQKHKVMWTGLDVDDTCKLYDFILVNLNNENLPFKADLCYTNQCFEHLEDQGILNGLEIISKCKVCLFCAANRRQSEDGIGHISCKDPNEWIEIIEASTDLKYNRNLTSISKVHSNMMKKGKYGKSFWMMTGLIFKNEQYI